MEDEVIVTASEDVRYFLNDGFEMLWCKQVQNKSNRHDFKMINSFLSKMCQLQVFMLSILN